VSPRRALPAAGAAAAAALTALLAVSCGSGGGEGPHCVKVERGPVEVRLVEFGEVEAREVRSVLAPISGEVIWVATEGTRLKPGEAVLKMNADDLRTRLEEDRRAGVGLEGQLVTAKKVAKATERHRRGAVRRAELNLEIAKQRLAEARSHPTADEKKMADLNLSSARMRVDLAKAEVKAMDALAAKGYTSKSKAKAARLSLIRAQAELARAEAAHREVLTGRPPETLRALTVGVKKAEMSLAMAKFDVEADKAAAAEEVAVAQTRYDVHRKRLARIQTDIDSAVASAPIDGVVALVDVWKGGSDMSPVQVGETHRRGREMLKIADISALRVKIHVNERDIVDVRVGQTARVRLVAHPGTVYPAKVAEVAVFADDKNRQLGSLAMEKSGMAGVNVVRVLLDLEVPEGAAEPRLGSSAVVEIVTARLPSALTVPLVALEWRDGKAFVRVRSEGGDREVQLGIRALTGDRAVIEKGLSEGEGLVVPAGTWRKPLAPE
jgi:HlyD family secretion protein